MKNFIPFVGALIALLGVFSTETLSAQELTVVSFEARTTDLTAKVKSREDLNGDAAALVRVQVAAPGVLFKGNIVGEVETGFGEYLVYMAKGSRHLRIYHKDYLFVPLDYEIPEKIQSNCTYLLKLEVPIYTHYNQIMLEKRIKKPRPQYGFEQHIEVGYQLEAKGYEEFLEKVWLSGSEPIYYIEKPLYTFSLNWIGGHRFNNTFYLGGGLNFRISHCEFCKDLNHKDEKEYFLTEQRFGGDIFVHGRAYLTKTRFSPFVALSAGVNLFCNRPTNLWSPYLNPEIGFNYRIKDHFSIYLTGGYATYFNEFDAWQFKLGFTL